MPILKLLFITKQNKNIILMPNFSLAQKYGWLEEGDWYRGNIITLSGYMLRAL